MTVLGEDAAILLDAMLALAAGGFPDGAAGAAYQRALLRAEAAVLVQTAASLVAWRDDVDDPSEQAAFDVFVMTYAVLDEPARARFEDALRRAA